MIFSSTPIHEATLPVQLTNRNDGRGHHWGRTSSERKRLAKALVGYEREPFEQPVALMLTRVLGKGQRLWDADSVGRGNAKELIDTLVSLGWFHDDSPKWIRPVWYRQDETRRQDGPAVVVSVFGRE